MDRFEACHAITAKWEGGWSNHKADPGGKTMYGVTEAVFHAWLKAGVCRSGRRDVVAGAVFRKDVVPALR